jgi:hypothetical protein
LVFLFSLIFFIGMAACSIDEQKQSYWPYIYGTAASFCLIGCLGIGHNFVHHKFNYFKYFFVLTGFTHDEWQIMHALSHHIYPNTELDFEAAALEPFGYFLRNKPENKFYTELILVLSYTFIQPLNFFLKCVVIPLTKKKQPVFWYLVPLTVLFTFYAVSGYFWYSLKLHLFIYGVYGFMANRILLCNHRLQELWSEGAERIEDFG